MSILIWALACGEWTEQMVARNDFMWNRFERHVDDRQRLR